MSILKYKDPTTNEWKAVGAPDLANVEALIDSKLADVPTPDVSGQINSHNSNPEAHEDIREAISNMTAYSASATAPNNTGIFWVDTGNDSILKYYNPLTSSWEPIGVVWGG